MSTPAQGTTAPAAATPAATSAPAASAPAGDAQAKSAPQPFVAPAVVAIDIGEATGLDKFKGMKLKGFAAPWTHPKGKTPPKRAAFKWREDQVRDLLLFWFSGADSRALKLIGHTGAGKTELVLQWHALLNMPLVVIGCNPRTEAQQLVGMMVSTGNGTTFADGPLITAARQGWSVLVDEYNLVDPGEASGLNAFLEGKPYTIPETGETIVPAPGFRIFATMNPKTSGYRGRQQQDMANDDRFVDLVVPYMSPDEELPLVEAVIAKIAQQLPAKPDAAGVRKLAESHVKVANTIRQQYMGVNDTNAALPCTMSTRTLLRWVEWSCLARALTGKGLFDPKSSAAHYALHKVLSGRQTPEVAEALHQIVLTETGEPRTAP